jgi:diguanylate cyclase (GGDEF)-like protein
MKPRLYTYRLAFVRAFQFFGFASFVKNFTKRAFDLVMAAIGLIILSPIFALIAIMIKRDTPGPVFYRGPRMGRNGRVFQMLKFRTMYERPQSYAGPRLTSKGDPRITPLGSWLRDTKINELPQLWNVLIGEMSWVGPRPEDPEIAKNWPAEMRAKIFSVRPGITSPASILYHDEEKLLSQKDAMSEYFKSILPDKLRLDLLYVHHNSFFSDLDTIFWTMAILLPRWAKTKIPEGYIFAGPFSRLVHRYVNWFVIDLVETLGIVGIVALTWRSQAPLNWGIEHVVFLAFSLAFLFSSFNSILGINRTAWSQATAGDIFGLIVSGWSVIFFVLGANYLESRYHWLQLPPLPTIMIISIGLLLQVVFIATRYRLRLLMLLASRWLTLRQNDLAMGDRVLIVGDGEGSQIAQWLLGRQMFRTAFSIIGMANDDDPQKYGMRVNGCWMLGSIKDIPQLIKKHDIGVILSTVPATAREVNGYIFNLCQNNNIRLVFLNDLLRMVERQVTQPIGNFDYPIWLDEGLEFKAMHDAITTLPNRYLFHNILKRSLAYARRYGSRLAVMFITLDGLDLIAENFGSKFSDQILVKAALQLIQCKRESDTLARIRDGKFALILENIPDENTADIVTKRMIESLSECLLAEKQKFDIHTNINVYLDEDGYDELESACYAEIETVSPVKKDIKVKSSHEHILAK